MLIKNQAGLDYRTIGYCMDKIMESNTGNTMYYGKVEIGKVEINNRIITIIIRYLKKYTEWTFMEVENNE